MRRLGMGFEREEEGEGGFWMEVTMLPLFVRACPRWWCFPGEGDRRGEIGEGDGDGEGEGEGMDD